MTAPVIKQIPCLSDNYGYLVHDADSGETVSIDSPDASAILAALDEEGWTLSQIWNTHHHWDHAGGNAALKAETGCTISAPAGERDMIPGADRYVREGDTVALGAHEARVIETPGHTRGHICYVMDKYHAAFVGDTLFSLGCGRLFEGTAQQMWNSLSKLMALPDATLIHCAHEYTLDNARFALTIEPENTDLQARAKEVAALRDQGRPTVPTTLALEKRTNPFLRADSAAIRARLNAGAAEDWEVFAKIRQLKDNF